MRMLRKNLANSLTFLRVLLVPILFYFTFTAQSNNFIFAALICMFTDAIDGTVARTLHIESQTGRMLDGLADACFYPTFVLGTIVLLHMTAGPYILMLISLFLFEIFSMVVVPIVFVGRITFIHLRTWQLSTYVLLLFSVISLLWHLYLPLLYIFVSICILASFETIAICVRDRKHTDDSIHSFFEKRHHGTLISVRRPK